MSTIYLSSTYDDLKDHRAAVAQVLRRAGHTVIGMEDYAAYDERPRDKCVADVVRSDLYVGLFAWRYGFVPKDNNPFGTSITQLEYQAAADGKRPVFLLSKDAPWPPAHIHAFAAEDQGRRMREFREQLVLAHGTNFFVTPDELAGKVLAAVSSYAAKLLLPQVVRHMQRTQLGFVANVVELGISEAMGVRMAIEQARNAILGLDFTSTTWWSTRLLLVALLAADHTEAEVNAPVHSVRAWPRTSVAPAYPLGPKKGGHSGFHVTLPARVKEEGRQSLGRPQSGWGIGTRRLTRGITGDGTNGRLSRAALFNVQTSLGVGWPRSQRRTRHEGVFR
jgi:hypothetical protein